MKRSRIRITHWLAIGLCAGSSALFVVSAWFRISHFSYQSTEFHEFAFAGGCVSYGILFRPVSYISMMQSRPGLMPGWRIQSLPLGWAVFNSIKLLPRVEWTQQFHHVFVPLWTPFAAGASWLAISWWRNRPPPPRYCSQCRYDLTGNMSGKCPECGSAVPIIRPIPAGETFRRRRRVVLRRRRVNLWLQRFAAVRRWSYTVGAVCIALWWAVSYVWVADHVSYEGDFTANQSLSLLTVSIERGRLNAVADLLYTAKQAPLPGLLPPAGWHTRRAGESSTLSVHSFRTSLDDSITISNFDLLEFPLWVPFLVLVLLAVHRWWWDRWRVAKLERRHAETAG